MSMRSLVFLGASVLGVQATAYDAIAGYVPGVVVAAWYREPDWPPERWVPYQLRLATGAVCYCETDADNTVRLLRPDELANGVATNGDGALGWTTVRYS